MKPISLRACWAILAANLAAAVLIVFVLVNPAQALPHGVTCVDRHNGGSYHTVCVEVNSRDTTAGLDLEGLGDPWDWNQFHDPAEIQFDYVRLWRCHPGCDLAKGVGDSGWIRTNSNQYSTAWYDLCNNPTAGQFHTEIRYRLKWTAEPGDPIGQWFVQNSNNYSNDCNP